ncbi:hypothetical protein [Candidatus Poriferisodalis sp.]|uniref:hypothetical protein n=1 Tax=Candidatus Poriferisodalis sp. TaxID=3101277 RepID=UPI003B52D4FF
MSKRLIIGVSALLLLVLLLTSTAAAHDPEPPQPDYGTCSSGDGAVIVKKASAPDLIAAYLVKGVLGSACIYGPGEELHPSADPVIVVGGTAAVPDAGLPVGASRIGGRDRYETAELIGRWATGDLSVIRPITSAAEEQAAEETTITGSCTHWHAGAPKHTHVRRSGGTVSGHSHLPSLSTKCGYLWR